MLFREFLLGAVVIALPFGASAQAVKDYADPLAW